MSLLQNSNAISAGGYDVNNSLRFRSSASAYLSRTPASAGNRQIWTWSAWIKRGTLGGASNVLFNCYNTASSTQTSIEFANDTLGVFSNDSSTVNLNLFTTQVFRDPSAWYHFVIAFDTTQATSSNRVKMYVNGSQITAFSTSTYPSLNYNGHINTTALHTTFATRTPSGLTDGYLADVNFIDGSAKTPSDFGETDTTTGVWKPKAYTGTYGTNGFYLKFSDIATTSGSNAGLGKDFSGNSNYWTTNYISVTSGTTYDAMTDSPTLTSATVANYAVLNPLWKASNLTLAGANLNVTSSGNGGTAISTIAMESGKYYCEVRLNSSTDATIIGIAISSFNPTTSTLTGAGGVGYYVSNGDKFVNGTQTAYGASCASGDIVGIAVDITAGTVTFYKNNTSQGAITHGLTGPFYFATSDASSASNIDQSWNFGQRPFSYTPPTGYVALNTYNLPDSTIKKGNSYMDATLWTGTGVAKNITNAAGFKPDLVWVKARSFAYSHRLADSVRGATLALDSSSTSAEFTDAGGNMTSFNSDGFGIGTYVSVNNNGTTYVGWQWQAGQGSTSSNTSGSITSTVSVNTTAGFSIVTYTGNGTSGATVGHGLGVAPKMIICKNRDAAHGWMVAHSGLTSGYNIELNGTAAQSNTFGRGLISTYSSSTFTLTAGSGGTSLFDNVNQNTIKYVAYCFAEISGFSKFGSYTGNGSTDGPFVYTGFRPKYIMLKSTTTAGSNWWAEDTSRSPYNAANALLFPNLSNAEYTTAGVETDILSNGFKLRTTNGDGNKSGDTFIFMAFAEVPTKYANAR